MTGSASETDVPVRLWREFIEFPQAWHRFRRRPEIRGSCGGRSYHELPESPEALESGDLLRSSCLRCLLRPPSSSASPLSVPPDRPCTAPHTSPASCGAHSVALLVPRTCMASGLRHARQSRAVPAGSTTPPPTTRPRHPAPAGAWVSRGRAGAVRLRCCGAGLKGASRSANPDEVSTAAERGAQRVPGAERLGAFWLLADPPIPTGNGAISSLPSNRTRLYGTARRQNVDTGGGPRAGR